MKFISLHFYWLLLFLLPNVTSGQSSASKLVITSNQDALNRIAHYFEWLEDPKGTLSIAQASSDSLQEKYLQSKSNTLDFGISESYYWLRLSVAKAPDDLHDYSIVFHEPNLSEVIFYRQSTLEEWSEEWGGYQTPITQKNLHTPLQVFELPFGSSNEVVLYFRLKANGMKSRVSIEKSEKISDFVSTRNFYSGLFGGFLILVIAYCVKLYFTLRHALFLSYAAVVFVLTICNLSLDGSIAYIHTQLGTSSLFLFAKLGHLANPAIQYYGILFLDLKSQGSRWLYRFHRIMLIVYVCTAVLTWFVPVKIGFLSMQIHGLFVFITLIITSILVNRKGHRFAIYFTLGGLSYLLGICLEVAHWQAAIPQLGHLTYVAYGQVLEISILTFALTRKMGIEKDQLEKKRVEAIQLALEQALENKRLVEQQNSLLDTKVSERTNELKEKNRQLEELNHVKDKFFSIISHDLRGPLGNLNLLMELFSNDDVSEEKMKSMVHEISKNTRSLTELLDNLLHWAKDQLQENKIQLTDFDLSTLIAKNMKLLQSYAAEKNIALENEFLESERINADQNMMDFVFRNLISNAIKFTPPGGKIQVRKQHDEKRLKVSVTDTGIGMKPEQLNMLFSEKISSAVGTADEVGVGLGLKLAKEFVEQNNGAIEVHSNPNVGSTFTVSIPV